MRYIIEYKVPTASGRHRTHVAYAKNRAEAKELCESIERLGYRITMLNYHDSEYGRGDSL